jgi:short-subunit dehydrogenase
LIDDRDVGMLVINAKKNLMAPFKDLTETELEEMVNVNLLHPTFLTKVFMERLKERATNCKSAVVIVGSN